MSLMKRIQAIQAATHPTPLQISTRPLPGDFKLVVRAQPGARLGMLDVALGAGKGSRGKGKRPLDDHGVYASTLRRLAASLVVYAADYERAAREDQAAAQRQAAASRCECGRPTERGAALCGECIPF